MGIGFRELLIILVIVLIVFGLGKLPKVMKDLGKGIKEFKDGMGAEGKQPENKQIGNSAEAAPTDDTNDKK